MCFRICLFLYIFGGQEGVFSADNILSSRLTRFSLGFAAELGWLTFKYCFIQKGFINIMSKGNQLIYNTFQVLFGVSTFFFF